MCLLFESMSLHYTKCLMGACIGGGAAAGQKANAHLFDTLPHCRGPSAAPAAAAGLASHSH